MIFFLTMIQDLCYLQVSTAVMNAMAGLIES